MPDKRHSSHYKPIVENPHSTVVAEYTPIYAAEQSYQSEAHLETAFIEQLKAQGYEYLPIKGEEDLIQNLRRQLEKLNDITFSEEEWRRFFKACLANPNEGIEEKTRTIQEDHIKILERDDGTTKNIYLIDKKNIHRNTLQVINQYGTAQGRHPNRYDVTILVNGLPLVHVELKRRGVALREAFNQIARYQRESFWAGSGLFEYVQVFVISNGTHTKYYSNTTRREHIREQGKKVRKGKRTSNSFKFTSWWADAKNQPITDLMDFTQTFFVKNTLLNILTRYCVFTSERQLLVMRPYQIAATERIINRIEISTNHKQVGTCKAGGYIWHATGSGKTLTSFKTALLATHLPDIDKVLFVVDRKDLDYQTMREYDKFQKGAANSNTSTRILKQQLEDPKARIIITTIQKLDRFIKKNKGHSVFNQHIVIIFDECHRSQFGQMHRAITRAFKRYHLFGFTGTPIFAQNAASREGIRWTTEQIVGDRLHAYTIVDAIRDGNVLPFKVDYVSTMREKEQIDDEQVAAINRESALLAPQRIQNVVRYILEHFDQKTRRNTYYRLHERRLRGFNSILAVASIDAAKRYYSEFQRQMESLPSDKRLKVALIYSFGQNEDIDGLVDENPEDTTGLDQPSRDFLERAIQDYNRMFGTDYDTSPEKFQNYYKDVSQRVKDREVDLLIVVNMFLTGFDATTLNTLWVDKNLRYHGLVQAFSRTNRILNSVKTHGNIVCFRNLEEATNRAFALFGDKEAVSVVFMRTFDEYYEGYTKNGKPVLGYRTLIQQLLDDFPLGQPIAGEEAKRDFVVLYGQILRMKNILSTFDDFEGKEILTPRQWQDYQSIYLDLYQEFRKSSEAEQEDIRDDLVFEMELVKQAEINVDHILMLIEKYRQEQKTTEEIQTEVGRVVQASVTLRNKKDLIMQFIASLDPGANVIDRWETFIQGKKKEELDQIIERENLNPQHTYAFIQRAFEDGYIEELGTDITRILPPVSRFSPDTDYSCLRERIIDALKAFFDRFYVLSGKEL